MPLDTVIRDDSGGSDDSILRFPDENKVRVGQGTDVGWRCTKRDGRNGHVGYKGRVGSFTDDDALARTKCFDLYSALPGRKVIVHF
jgi:hypothetical protein